MTTKPGANSDGRPSKPPTAYFLFMRERGDEVKGLSGAERTRTLSTKWKELGEEEKQAYNNRAKELKDAYKIELERWKQEHPDEAEGAMKREPVRAAVKELRVSRGASEKDLKIFFILAHLKAYAKEHSGATIPATKRAKALLIERFEALADEERAAWQTAWEALAETQRGEMREFYESWAPNA
ncbi:HMG (high mobility group) box-containing protein [Giardia muris]|uniref:HMG (High mobility group) box-containing protein n=1 Tax=Giardia muris TaxID=5742 RepID=A0A4Z1T5E3_GIAMU|nr:HMG (high mobility group) box-containing protein [Giardia muris]|eukprot:TNJ27739.1 HMG (high mobility group) box-containing protein [Giardia muris]